MKTLSMKSLVGALMLFSAPALAGSTTSIPAFEARITAAKSPTSPGGTTILRSEIRTALDEFLNDAGYGVDSAERAHLTTRLSDTQFQQSMTGTAAKYFADFYEVNDTLLTGYPLNLYPVAQTPAVLFGAVGGLSGARIYEGYIPNGQGVANQQTLGEAFSNAFGPQASIFEPISPRELVGQLSAYTYNVDEAEGAVAYITQISRNSNRLYITGWSCRGCGAPGYTQGFAIAAVSTDRRFVRMMSVTTYAD
ncbi:hypothetical protein D7X55_16010 [Corallococcus sp. AB049A]|uniref:Uncharacterized protein n=1 Tax=Corallococcus interemptor TaxID=2316720 RepID=A0A3A8Q8D1_9BACT|nr:MULTISPECIES: hypothetical protein [Corallococcus]RKH46511.1 hypothetical protein D7Y23_23720 [Corallococcus sp. AB050B]RKH63791.1 hypothetical protein D7X96_27020 [Corallococcus interemptor]RKI65688.1 hypothetical protein D7X55_16010 [Corallococcus sp. AB049A]